jgi:hypothetical protein
VVLVTGWFNPFDELSRKSRRSLDQPAFVSFLSPIELVTWSFTCVDTLWAPRLPRVVAPAFAYAEQPVGISGIAWFEPPDRDRPALKVHFEAPPAISLTPDTLPVGIFGMAWFEPPDRDRPALKVIANSVAAWMPQFIQPPAPAVPVDFTYPFIANVGTLMNR